MIAIKDQESLLTVVSGKLTKRITVYAIGGNAMIFLGYKDSTVDVDLVFDSENDRKGFIAALKSLGFELMDSCKVYGTRQNQPIMLFRTMEERFDLFLEEVINFIFSKNMKGRAEKVFEFGENLILKIADLHDIILMKCATDREKDKEDIRSIVENSEIDWSIIASEAKHQIEMGKKTSVFFLLETLQKIKDDMGVEVPRHLFDEIWDSLYPEKHRLKKVKSKLTVKKHD